MLLVKWQSENSNLSLVTTKTTLLTNLPKCSFKDKNMCRGKYFFLKLIYGVYISVAHPVGVLFSYYASNPRSYLLSSLTVPTMTHKFISLNCP